MGVENTTDRIITYLNIPKTNYAIFLDGAWGVGKSYFIFNTLKPKIESETQYDIQYFSLNGVKNIEALKKQVLFSLLSKKKQTTTKILSVVSAFSSSLTTVSYVGKFSGPFQFFANAAHNKLSDVNIEKKMKNKLLVFDDLERVQSEEVIKEFFGFISMAFLELTDTKIIIIGNENKIVEKFNNGQYTTIKEKVIGETILFKENNLSEIYNDLYSPYNSNELITGFFLEHQVAILEAFNKWEILNIRIIKNCIRGFYVMIKEFKEFLEKCEKEQKFGYMRDLFLNYTILHNEISSGNTDVAQMDLKDWNIILSMNIDGPVDSETMRRLVEKYMTISSVKDKDFKFHKLVADYAMTGYLDKDLLSETVEYFESISPKNHVKLEVEHYELVSGFRELKETEFEERTNKIISLMEGDSVTIILFIRVCCDLYAFEEKGLMDGIDWEEKIKRRYQSLLKNLTVKVDDESIEKYYHIKHLPNFFRDELSKRENDIEMARAEDEIKLWIIDGQKNIQDVTVLLSRKSLEVFPRVFCNLFELEEVISNYTMMHNFSVCIRYLIRNWNPKIEFKSSIDQIYNNVERIYVEYENKDKIIRANIKDLLMDYLVVLVGKFDES